MTVHATHRDLCRLIARMRRRLWLKIIGRGASAGLWGSAALLLVLALVQWRLPVLPPIASLTIGLLPVLAGLATALLLRRPTPLQAARRLDRQLQARGLLLTAWGVPAEPSEVETLLLVRASERLRNWQTTLKDLPAVPQPRSLPLALAGTTIASLLLFLSPPPRGMQTSSSGPSSQQATAELTPASPPASPAKALLELARHNADDNLTQARQKGRATNPDAPPSSAPRHIVADRARQAERKLATPRHASQTEAPTPSPAQAPANGQTGGPRPENGHGPTGRVRIGGRDRVGTNTATSGPTPVPADSSTPRLASEQIPLSRSQTATASTTGAGTEFGPIGRVTTPMGEAGSPPAASIPDRGLDHADYPPALRAYASHYLELVHSKDPP